MMHMVRMFTDIRMHVWSFITILVIFLPAHPATARQQDGRLGERVEFSARDSLTFQMREERIARLFGNTRVTHPAGELTSGRMDLNLDRNLMIAESEARRMPERDTVLTLRQWLALRNEIEAPGDTLSEPLLRRDTDEIRSRRIQFNYVTERGKFDNARLPFEQGTITGGDVKNVNPHVVFIQDGRYSTCDLPHPHYYIKARRMKVVEEDEVFFTSARLYILDIPYPIAFPFGYLPSQLKRQRSGLLEPRLAQQEQQRRGIGLQNLGWFQYFSDYLTGMASFDIFTSGTFYADGNLNYSVRNRFTGNLQLAYSIDQGLESTDPDFTRRTERRIGVNHNHTISPFASLSANVNLRTSDFYRANSYNIEDRAETSTNSTMSYNYRQPDGLYTFSVSAQHNENFQTNTVQLGGPNATFTLRRLTPFERRQQIGDKRWYETINLSYNSRFQSRFNYRPLDADTSSVPWYEALFNPSLYREQTGDIGHINFGLQQNADISAQLTSSQFVNLTSNFRIVEYWVPETVRQTFNPETNNTVTRIERGFTAARTFSAGLNLGTTLYGISNARIGSLQGFRHTFRPSVSFNYSPDFSDPSWGYFREVAIDTLGNTREYSIFQRSIIGGPSAGEQRSLGFSFTNVLETKQVRRDSTGERTENNIRLIDNLGVNFSYNFAADNFRLSPVNTSLSSNILRQIRINASATFNPYAVDSLGRQIDRYLWDDGGFLRLTNFTINASTNFSSAGSGSGMRIQAGRPYYPRYYDPLNQGIFGTVDPGFFDQPVQPISVNWSINLNFRYQWTYVDINTTRKSAILNAQNIQFRLTPEWQVGTSLGYDFIQRDLTPSQFSVTRTLHCWNLSFQWNPFGDFQYYMFSLTVNDSQIQGLLQKLPFLDRLQSGSSPINRFR
jgi:hypothetical protein